MKLSTRSLFAAAFGTAAAVVSIGATRLDEEADWEIWNTKALVVVGGFGSQDTAKESEARASVYYVTPYWRNKATGEKIDAYLSKHAYGVLVPKETQHHWVGTQTSLEAGFNGQDRAFGVFVSDCHFARLPTGVKYELRAYARFSKPVIKNSAHPLPPVLVMGAISGAYTTSGTDHTGPGGLVEVRYAKQHFVMGPDAFTQPPTYTTAVQGGTQIGRYYVPLTQTNQGSLEYAYLGQAFAAWKLGGFKVELAELSGNSIGWDGSGGDRYFSHFVGNQHVSEPGAYTLDNGAEYWTTEDYYVPDPNGNVWYRMPWPYLVVPSTTAYTGKTCTVPAP